MNIIVNGKIKEFRNELTLSEVLKELHVEDKVMAAALNMEIVKQDRWDKQILKNDDKLELLDFVGGG